MIENPSSVFINPRLGADTIHAEGFSVKMDETLYSVFDATEDTHWWFAARRAIALSILRPLLPPGSPRILDVGCGTGSTLKDLEKLGEAVGRTSRRKRSPSAKRGDAATCGESRRMSSPSGTVSSMLSSRSTGFDPDRLTYFCTLLFPLVAVIRVGFKLFHRGGRGIEFKIPGPQINRACRKIFASEATWLKHHDFPFGSSLMAVCRRRGEAIRDQQPVLQNQ